MVPSESLDAEPSKLHVRPVQELVNDDTGSTFGEGVPAGGPASISSTEMVIGDPVADDERYVETPRAPLACSEGVESLAVRRHSAGSGTPSSQTRAARSVDVA